jgi:hypothetical protein
MLGERFTFALGVDLVLGDPKEFEVRDWPMTTFAPDTMISSAPCQNFVELSSIQIDVTELCVDSSWDAYGQYNGRYNFKAALMAHGARVIGKYSGIIPAGYSPGQRFRMIFTFQGAKP